uniref:FH2 domain-containing protein n=1 Tax=Oncorhynchus kisutch TaxID=8019 RepID=A0A8C7IP38_ONCKI
MSLPVSLCLSLSLSLPVSLSPCLSLSLFSLSLSLSLPVSLSPCLSLSLKSKGFSRLLSGSSAGNYMNAGSRNAQSYGFDLGSLCKLKDTKSADQKSTLLHFLAAVCEEEFPEVTKFSDDLQHVDRASRVSAESLEKNLVQMERQLVQLERDLDTFSSPDDSEDLFTAKIFSTSAREQYQKLMIMHSNMGTLYQNMLDYFALDSKKTSVEELFTDLSNFRTMFLTNVIAFIYVNDFIIETLKFGE